MKKVAVACLIMCLTVPAIFGVTTTGAVLAQDLSTTGQPRRYTPKFAIEQNQIDRLATDEQDLTSSLEERNDEKPIKGRKKKDTNRRDYERERAGRDPYPDYSQPSHLVEMSFRVAPGVTYNTAEGTDSYGQFTSNGAGVRLSLGPSLDYFFFKNRYSFSTGLWYTVKRSGYRMPGSFGTDRWQPGAPVQHSVYNLQYLQIPLSVKMFANNIAPALRLYIQCGGIADIKLSEKAVDPDHNALYQFASESGSYRRQYGFGDFGMLLGTGVQYRLNNTNAINVGVSYQRGLIDVARGKSLVSKNNILGLELGFKF